MTTTATTIRILDPRHHEPREGTQTPWGPAQYIDPIAPGVVFAGTAGHGGVWVHPELFYRVRIVAARYPGAAHLVSSGRRRWFEEDCEAALVVLAFPEHHDPRQVAHAELSAAHWYGGAR